MRLAMRAAIVLGLMTTMTMTMMMITDVTREAEAAPVTVPDLTRCELAVDKPAVGANETNTQRLNCCIPIVGNGPPVRFSASAYRTNVTRVRRPAHRVSDDYAAKYALAYARMRALPPTDPRSFKVQADLHCAFCNGGYRQGPAGGDKPLQVHFSWLFLPWHRMYLYFHERILGSLIGDPTFALAYWNWDDQRDGGNVLPPMFLKPGSSLFDANRSTSALNGSVLVRLSPASRTQNDTLVASENLNAMYQAIVTARTPELFIGGPYVLGSDLSNSTVRNAPFGGSIENTVHNGIHYWTGSRTNPLGEDMGTFSSAGRDPVFYSHHTNVDRLWDVWRYRLFDGDDDERRDFNDTDFLDAEFVFYDEHSRMVTIRVRDVLDIAQLGYRYKKVSSDKLWARFEPVPASNGSALAAAIAAGVPYVGPAPLNGTVELAGQRLVARAERPRARGVKPPPRADEVLVVEAVDVVRDSFVQLVLFVNLPNATNATLTNSAEYVGTFNVVPSASPHRRLVTDLRFEIGDNIKRVGSIQSDDQIVLTIVVKGTERVTIQGLRIEYQTS